MCTKFEPVKEKKKCLEIYLVVFDKAMFAIAYN